MQKRATHSDAFMERRLDTFMVIESRRVCSLGFRTSLFSEPSMLVQTMEEEVGGGGDTRGMIFTVVPLRASVCSRS